MSALPALAGIVLLVQSQNPAMDLTSKNWQLVTADGRIVASGMTNVQCAKLREFRRQVAPKPDRIGSQPAIAQENCTKQ